MAPFVCCKETTMLVLARKLGESIRIGDDVRITVIQIRSGRVRLGIEAPGHVRIHRSEIELRDVDFRGGERVTELVEVAASNDW
jgi:carbon storage regulator